MLSEFFSCFVVAFRLLFFLVVLFNVIAWLLLRQDDADDNDAVVRPVEGDPEGPSAAVGRPVCAFNRCRLFTCPRRTLENPVTQDGSSQTDADQSDVEDHQAAETSTEDEQPRHEESQETRLGTDAASWTTANTEASSSDPDADESFFSVAAESDAVEVRDELKPVESADPHHPDDSQAVAEQPRDEGNVSDKDNEVETATETAQAAEILTTQPLATADTAEQPVAAPRTSLTLSVQKPSARRPASHW